MRLVSTLIAISYVNVNVNVAAFQPSSIQIRARAASASASSSSLSMADKKKIVVIGNGMVGQRFMENMIDLDKEEKCTLATFCEEKRAAYNRVKLTSYFETLDPSDLSMTDAYEEDGTTAWFKENDVEIFLNDKAVSMDTEAKTIVGESGKKIDYDVAVLATGSFRKYTVNIRGRDIFQLFSY